MPSLNRKGPEGKGSMTGRQMGLCSGNAERGNDIAFRGGRGFRRFGNRRGMQRHGMNPDFMRNVTVPMKIVQLCFNTWIILRKELKN
jgi:hypothetical protein